MPKTRISRTHQHVQEVAYAYYCALNGGIPALLTGTETLGETKQRFALMVARELHVPVPKFIRKTTLGEAIKRFEDLILS